MKRDLFQVGLFIVVLLLIPLHAHASIPASNVEQLPQYRFAPVMVKSGTLAPGALGLPGEQITWTISITNQGTAAGTDVVISDVVRGDLRIDRVENARGTFSISDQTVVLSIPRIEPGETLDLRIVTTVQHSPPDGRLLNQATMTGVGPNGPVNNSAAAEVLVPATLPATGYEAPTSLPGDGEPPVWVFALGASMVVCAAAYVVWRRGSLRGFVRR